MAGPPCQPWARGGKQLGLADHRAPLLDEVLRTIGLNKPLAILMEESDRVATYAGGKWWQAKVAELEAMGYHVKWCILSAAQHGVPRTGLGCGWSGSERIALGNRPASACRTPYPLR